MVICIQLLFGRQEVRSYTICARLSGPNGYSTVLAEPADIVLYLLGKPTASAASSAIPHDCGCGAVVPVLPLYCRRTLQLCRHPFCPLAHPGCEAPTIGRAHVRLKGCTNVQQHQLGQRSPRGYRPGRPQVGLGHRRGTGPHGSLYQNGVHHLGGDRQRQRHRGDHLQAGCDPGCGQESFQAVPPRARAAPGGGLDGQPAQHAHRREGDPHCAGRGQLDLPQGGGRPAPQRDR